MPENISPGIAEFDDLKKYDPEFRFRRMVPGLMVKAVGAAIFFLVAIYQGYIESGGEAQRR